MPLLAQGKIHGRQKKDTIGEKQELVKTQNSEHRVVCSLLFEKGENIALSGRGKFYEKAKEPRIACVP